MPKSLDRRRLRAHARARSRARAALERERAGHTPPPRSSRRTGARACRPGARRRRAAHGERRPCRRACARVPLRVAAAARAAERGQTLRQGAARATASSRRVPSLELLARRAAQACATRYRGGEQRRVEVARGCQALAVGLAGAPINIMPTCLFKPMPLGSRGTCRRRAPLRRPRLHRRGAGGACVVEKEAARSARAASRRPTCASCTSRRAGRTCPSSCAERRVLRARRRRARRGRACRTHRR